MDCFAFIHAYSEDNEETFPCYYSHKKGIAVATVDYDAAIFAILAGSIPLWICIGLLIYVGYFPGMKTYKSSSRVNRFLLKSGSALSTEALIPVTHLRSYEKFEIIRQVRTIFFFLETIR